MSKPISLQPRLAVVLPVRDGATTLLRAMNSILHQLAEHDELIIVDDASTDDSGSLAMAIEDPRVRVLASTGLGPSGARNIGVAASHSEWVAFVDADDELKAGWRAALSAFLSEPLTVVVLGVAELRQEGSSPLVQPSFLEPAQKGVEVRLLAGSFAVRRDVFEACGAYDEHLAFSENTDLGLRIRDQADAAGLLVATAPDLCVIVHRGARHLNRRKQHGGDVTAAALRLWTKHPFRFSRDQKARRLYRRIVIRGFAARPWSALVLIRLVRAGTRSRSRMGLARPGPVRKVMLVTAADPNGSATGSRQRCWVVRDALSSWFDVRTAIAGEPPEEAGSRYVVWKPTLRRPRSVATALWLSGLWPYIRCVSAVARSRASLRPAMQSDDDLLWCHRVENAVKLPTGRRPTLIIDIDDLEFTKRRDLGRRPARFRLRDVTRRIFLRADSWRLRRLYRRTCAAAAVLVVSNPADVIPMGQLVARPVMLVRNSLPPSAEMNGSRHWRSRPTSIVFIGQLTYGPNRDAASWLADALIPELRRLHGDIRLRLVGRYDAKLSPLAGIPGVTLVGEVDRVDRELADADCAIVPIRFGGGTRIKCLEAAAAGIPMIATSFAVNGLGLAPDHHYLKAESLADFVTAWSRLQNEWSEEVVAMADRAQRLVREQFSAAAVATDVRRAVRLATPHPSTGRDVSG